MKQGPWKDCSKCQILFNQGNVPAPCAAGGNHVVTEGEGGGGLYDEHLPQA